MSSDIQSAPSATLPGPSRRITVEPIKVPRVAPAEPVKVPEPERPREPAPA